VTALKRSQVDSTEELDVSFNKSYENTLRQHHSFVVRPIFAVRSIALLITPLTSGNKVAMKACPYRKDFYAKLGSDHARVAEQFKKWTEALEKQVNILNKFFAEGKHDQGF
jgi:hypothetical protein